MERHEVVVVGGGPAGSTLAWRLQKAGIDVVVLDRKEFPRNKICAGWVTPEVLASLAVDASHYRAEGLTLQPITAFRTGLIGGQVQETRYDKVVSFGILRREFDHYLLKRSGAIVQAPVSVKTLAHQDDAWIVNETHSARLLVGAGGHFCPVARHLSSVLSSDQAEKQVVMAQEIEFPLTDAQAASCRALGEMPELYFCDDLKGYGWVFLKGNYLNVGLGREDNHGLADHVQRFVRWLKDEHRVPTDTPEKWPGHAYLLYHHSPRPLVGQAALLVGDAVGLAYPQSGEGIRPAVESALLAAEAILDARGDYSAERLACYEMKLTDRLGQRRVPALADRIPQGPKRWIARQLLTMPWFTRNLVINEWFLHARQPVLNFSE